MRRRAAAVALALAVLAAVVWWALRPGEERTPAATPRGGAADAAPRDSATGGPARAAAAPAAQVPSAPAAPLPTPAVAAAAPRADRLVTPEEKALRKWGPKGRVVEAGTGAPLPWWTVWIQVRRRDNPAAVETRILERGLETGKGDDAAFDLGGARLARGDATLQGASPSSLEYRIGARAARHRSTSTPWRPLSDAGSLGDVTIEMETDALATLFVRVRNPDGTNFRGHVSANFMEDDLEFHGGISADTDAGGRARLQEVPSGEFDVRLSIHVKEPGAWAAWPIVTEPQRVSLPAGGTAEAEFSVPSTGEIAITWTDAHGAELKGNWTQVDGRASYSAHVDRIVGLPSGPAPLVLRVNGYHTWKSTVQVVAGQVTKVEARFEPGEDPK